MGFKIVVVDGEDRKTVHEINDKRVTRVSVQSRTGEVTAFPVSPDETDILLSFEFAPAGKVTLDDVDLLKPGYKQNQTEKDLAAAEKELAKVRPSTNTGTDQFTQEAVEAQAEAAAAPEPEAELDLEVNA